MRVLALSSRALRLGAISLLSVAGAVLSLEGQNGSLNVSRRAAQLESAYGKLPLSFEANEGQSDRRVRFLAHGQGYDLFLTPGKAVLTLTKLKPKPQEAAQSCNARQSARLAIELVGANPRARFSGADQLPGKANYFVGNDPAKWRVDVPTFSKVSYRGAYRGIDVLYYGNQRQLEYDFVVAPGAHPKRIRLRFDGAEQVQLDAEGDLRLRIGGGDVRLRKPVLYQEVAGIRKEVSGGYVLRDGGQIGFRVGAYDRQQALVIDPVLVYSTYLGGTGFEMGYAIAVDASGNAYVAGQTSSTNFPITAGAFQTTLASDPALGNPDGFITKLNPAGNQAVYSTYLGGSCTDIIFGIAVNSAGEAYVTGSSNSGINPQTGMADCGPLSKPFLAFPQVNAFQSYGGTGDAFVTKLNAAGNGLIFSSFLGGSGSEFGRAIAVDAGGNAYVTGDTISRNFPATVGAFQTANAGGEDAFATKVSSTGGLVYSTYLGGGDLDSGRGIAVDALGNAYITGVTGSGSLNVCGMVSNPPAFPTTPLAYQPAIAPSGTNSSCIGPCCKIPNITDAFVTKLDSTGSVLIYSTYLGGGTAAVPGDGAVDEGHAIAVDTLGNAYITGLTASSDFPTKNPIQATYGGGSQPAGDAFVTQLDPTGSMLVYSTYLGGGSFDEGNGIAVDASGEAYVAGTGGSMGFPIVDPIPSPGPPPPPNTPPPPPGYGGFVTKFNAGGATLAYSTIIFATTTGRAIGLDPSTNAYVTGETSGGIQTVNPFQPMYAGNVDAYVVKLGPSTSGPPSPQATTLSFTASSATMADFHDAAQVQARLTTSSGGVPVAAKTVSFTLGAGPSCSAMTDVTGTATCSLTPNQAAGSYTLMASFSGDSSFGASSTSTSFMVTKEETVTKFTATSPTVLSNGSSATFSATLKEDGTTLIAGRTLTFTLGSGGGAQSCSGVTDGTGTASCSIPVNQPSGANTVRAVFAGDTFYQPSSDMEAVTVLTFLAGGGSFVIGNLNATVGSAVTFWGAQWAKANSLGGGTAPEAFKGFADGTSTNPPACGGSWTTSPGNSSNPPASVPSFMAAIASSSIVKSGATISGNVVSIVVIKTDAGYSSNPGHPGTGTVVAVLPCR